MGFNLKMLKISPELSAWHYSESIVYQTDHRLTLLFGKMMCMPMTL